MDEPCVSCGLYFSEIDVFSGMCRNCVIERNQKIQDVV